MAIFNYIAKDAAGKQATGIVDASNERNALLLIKTKGLYVISLNKRNQDTLKEYIKNIRGISGKEKVTFTRQLATMVAAGLPLPKSLEVLIEQTVNPQMKRVISDCLRDIEGGSPLSVSVSKFPNVFSPTYRALLRAGEASGKMQEVLLKLADTMEAQQEFKSKFTAALVYPAIVTIAMIGVFIIMMLFVIPKISNMFISMKLELPLPTRMILGLSSFVVGYWWLLAILGVGAFFFYRYFEETQTGKETIATVSFKLPIFGDLNKKKELTEFSQTLALLIGSGIPIVESLHIVSDVLENVLLKISVEKAANSVEKGFSLSKYLKADTNFPPVVGQMVAVGEETGTLDSILLKLSEYYAVETEHTLKGLSTAIEPVVLILLGGMIGVLIISIISPIYKLTSSL